MTATRPQDLPELRGELHERYSSSSLQRVWTALASHMGGSAKWYRHVALAMLSGAELYWVSASMADLAETGARTVSSFPLQEEDLPSPHGLLIFERPITAMREAQQGQALTSMSGILWGSMHTSDWTGVTAFPLRSTSFLPVSEVSVPLGCHVRGGRETAPTFYYAMQTCWLLMQQTLAVETTVEPDRAARKRLKRAGREPGAVRVIELRRPQGGGGAGDGDRDYHHRWVVRGHWRQQWFPKREVHRPVWIAPHIKGPEGAPLIGGDKVYAWKR